MADVPLHRKRGVKNLLKIHSPKPPFYKTALLFPLDSLVSMQGIKRKPKRAPPLDKLLQCSVLEEGCSGFWNNGKGGTAEGGSCREPLSNKTQARIDTYI